MSQNSPLVISSGIYVSPGIGIWYTCTALRYKSVVECRTLSPADRVRSPVGEKCYISIFSPVTYATCYILCPRTVKGLTRPCRWVRWFAPSLYCTDWSHCQSLHDSFIPFFHGNILIWHHYYSLGRLKLRRNSHNRFLKKNKRKQIKHIYPKYWDTLTRSLHAFFPWKHINLLDIIITVLAD